MARQQTVANTAADPLVRYAPIEIDGDTYHLAYDFNSIAVAEHMTGINLFRWHFQRYRWEDLTAEQFRGLFYASLLKAQPQMSLEDAGRLIRIDSTYRILEAIEQAYILSIPDKKKDTKGNEPIAAAS